MIKFLSTQQSAATTVCLPMFDSMWALFEGPFKKQFSKLFFCYGPQKPIKKSPPQLRLIALKLKTP